jgi:hypothetical protein
MSPQALHYIRRKLRILNHARERQCLTDLPILRHLHRGAFPTLDRRGGLN